MNKEQLWVAISAYKFENLVPTSLKDEVTAMFGGANATTRAFASKIAKKLGWTNDFARRAIKEYKRFVYLGVISKSVTPSKVIDQVWHEHVLFTKGYRDFCENVIEHDFDHYPEIITLEDQIDLFDETYHKTMNLYKQEFGVDASTDIWGTPKYKPQSKAHVSEQMYTPSVVQEYNDYTPLYLAMIDNNTPISNSHNDSSHEFSGFGGGSFGGGGSSASWDTDTTSTSHSSHSSHDAPSCSSSDSGHSSCSSSSCSSSSSSCSSSSCSSSSCSSSSCSSSSSD